MANYYVDPTFVGESTGSIDQPFKSWDDVSISSNNNYYMKKGTTFVATQGVGGNGSNSHYDIENTTFSTYGEGERPFIDFQGSFSFFKFSGSKNLIIEGYKIENGPGGVISIGAYGTRTSYHNVVRDCELIGGWRGVNSEVWKTQYDADIKDLLIENCVIHRQGGDGVFCKHNNQSAYDGVVVRGCHFYDQNQKWHSNPMASDGDCVHLLRCTNFLIEDNIMDRRGTSNKFCFAWTDGVIGDEQGVVRGNTFYSPYYSNLIGSNALYFHQGLNYLEFDNNIVIGRHEPSNTSIAVGVMRANTQYVRNNVFDETGYLSIGSASHTFWGNNLFNCKQDDHAISAMSRPYEGKNNIFLLPVGAQPISGHNPDPSSIVINGDDSDFSQLNFLDLLNGNYHVTTNSDQLLNLGIEYSWANSVDLDGLSVPQGTAREIGPYEYNENSVPSPPPPATLIQPFNNAVGVSRDITLKWYPVSNATGYKLTFDGGEIDLGISTEYQLDSLEYGSVYEWKVVPYNANGEAKNCPIWTFTTENEIIPGNFIDLTWNFVPDASGYKISLGTDNAPTNIENMLDVGNINTYRFENPEYLTTYYWQVVPYNEGGDAENCPVWSFTTEDDGTLPPPSPTTPVYPPDGAINIPIM